MSLPLPLPYLSVSCVYLCMCMLHWALHAAQVAYGPDGSPSKALQGFCKKNGVPVGSVTRQADSKGTEYVWALVEQQGRPTSEVCPSPPALPPRPTPPLSSCTTASYCSCFELLGGCIFSLFAGKQLWITRHTVVGSYLRHANTMRWLTGMMSSIGLIMSCW